MNESESAKAKEKWIPDIRRIVPNFFFLALCCFVVAGVCDRRVRPAKRG